MTPEALLDLFVVSPVGMIALDEEGHVEVANPAARRLLHPFVRDGALSPLFEALAPYTGDLAAAVRRESEPRAVIAEGVPLVRNAGGLSQGVLLSLVRTAPGRLVAMVTPADSVAEAKLIGAQTRRRFDAVADAVRDYALYEVDVDGRITAWTSAAGRVHQTSADDAIGSSMARFLPASAGGEEHVRATLAHAVRNGWAEEEGERLRGDGTSFAAATVITALAADDGLTSRFQVVTRDLSERRRFEAAVREGSVAGLDPLTGVASHRAFQDTASLEVARARRYGQPLTVLLVDPDNFSALTEQHGSEFADECLRAIAWVCRQESRTTDVVGRIGGNEFAVLLPSTELSGGLVLAERIRERMQKHIFAGEHEGVRCTLSIGVAGLDEAEGTLEQLLTDAERAVERAKAAGRNLVVGYDD